MCISVQCTHGACQKQWDSLRGSLFTVFLHQEPCVRGPPSKDLYQVLRGGSSYTRFLMREHSKLETPPGGGVSFDQSESERVRENESEKKRKRKRERKKEDERENERARESKSESESARDRKCISYVYYVSSIHVLYVYCTRGLI